MASSDIGDWYRSIPKLTKWWFTGSIVLPLAAKFGLLNRVWLFLLFEPFIYGFQIWRPLTCVLYYPVGFPYLMNLYFLYSYSTRVETGIFGGKPADYVFMLVFCWVCIIIIGLMAGFIVLMDPMIFSVLYLWCQINKDEIVTFWFGTRFKAMYLPWVLLVFRMIIADGGIMELVGIIVGHLYFFLMFKYPQDFGGARLLSVPLFLYKYFPNRQGGVGGFGTAPSSRRQANDGGDGRAHNWGMGNNLGGD